MQMGWLCHIRSNFSTDWLKKEIHSSKMKDRKGNIDGNFFETMEGLVWKIGSLFMEVYSNRQSIKKGNYQVSCETRTS